MVIPKPVRTPNIKETQQGHPPFHTHSYPTPTHSSPTHFFIHQSNTIICPSTCPPIHPSISPSIYLSSIYPSCLSSSTHISFPSFPSSICPTYHPLSFLSSNHPPFFPPILSSIHLSIFLPSLLSIHSSIHPFTYKHIWWLLSSRHYSQHKIY